MLLVGTPEDAEVGLGRERRRGGVLDVDVGAAYLRNEKALIWPQALWLFFRDEAGVTFETRGPYPKGEP